MIHLLIAFFLLFNGNIDCDKFYREHLDPLSIDGRVTKKEIGEKFYVIWVKEANEKEVKVELLKNMIGFNVYTFVQPGSYFQKKKGRRDLHVLTENALDGSIKGQIFDDLCKVSY